jgi:glycosyltransferase involved in cell wall biosynthesis
MEGIVLGKIVLCTGTTGVSEYLQHKQSGFVMDENTPEFVRDGIIQCLEAKADWPRIARAGHALFLSLFTQEAFDERIKQSLSI